MDVEVNVPGTFSVYNSLTAVAICKQFNVAEDKIKAALKKEGHVLENIAEGKLDDTFHVRPAEDDLYMFMRTEDIAALNQAAELQRMQIISPDGPANHMRREVNALTEEQFKQFINYQMTVCEREDLLGASAHTVDILKK